MFTANEQAPVNGNASRSRQVVLDELIITS